MLTQSCELFFHLSYLKDIGLSLPLQLVQLVTTTHSLLYYYFEELSFIQHRVMLMQCDATILMHTALYITISRSLVLYLMESFPALLSLRADSRVLFSFSIFAVSTVSCSNSRTACWDIYYKLWVYIRLLYTVLCLLYIRCYTLPFFSVEVQRGRAQHLLTEPSSTVVSPPLSHISKPDTQTS